MATIESALQAYDKANTNEEITAALTALDEFGGADVIASDHVRAAWGWTRYSSDQRDVAVIRGQVWARRSDERYEDDVPRGWAPREHVVDVLIENATEPYEAVAALFEFERGIVGANIFRPFGLLIGALEDPDGVATAFPLGDAEAERLGAALVAYSGMPDEIREFTGILLRHGLDRLGDAESAPPTA